MKSLSARLVAATLGVFAVGLLVAGVATYSALRSFLLDRVDAQLAGAGRTVELALLGRGGPFAEASLRQLGAVVPGVYVQVRGPADDVLVTVEGRERGEAVPPPALPSAILPIVHGTDDDNGAPPREAARLLTVPAVASGDERYRVRVSPLLHGAVVVALPLSGTDATLNRLLLVEALVTLCVLLGAAAAASWVVGIGLRPLADIEATAARIAEGDLTDRVTREDDTEVGRLGRALNVMLGRIQSAFGERTASEERALASESRMRRFVGDASHELRTPVAAVRAYAELYRRGADRHPEDLGRLLARIEEEAARMGVLVDDLLLLTRLDEGRPLERAPVDLGAVAADAVSAARALEPDRAIHLVVEGSVEVLGDQARLRQVVDNLLANVRAHVPTDAAARVRVTTMEQDAVVEVADDGPGLAPDQLPHLFERFYRGDGSRSRDSGGSGLGLSIVAAIAEAHGGGASASGANGAAAGAVFRVRIPALTDGRPAPPRPGAPPPDASTSI